MSVPWPETETAGKENRHELVLTGSEIKTRITASGLDDNIFKLEGLNYLNISEVGLSSISDNLSNLVNLQTLVLHSNNLASIPDTVNKLQKLKNLDVSRNSIKSLPADLSGLEQLVSLNASSNQLVKVPNLGKNVKLATLDFANNKLNEFPDICYADLVLLAELKLNKNEIEVIPGDIKVLGALKMFDISENKIKTIPYEVYECSKLKEINLKENPISDKRLLKLVTQCRSKQVLDYIKQHCKRTIDTSASGDSSKSNKKPAGKKGNKDRKSESDDLTSDLTHKIQVLHVSETLPNIKITDKVKTVRPHILACIVNNLNFDEQSFKKFIQLQTKLHDSVCEKRNAATIATHDLSKIIAVGEGDLTYTADLPQSIKIRPLMRSQTFSGAQLFTQLQNEAENLRKEKKRNVYSGIHRFLYLLEGKPMYPCLMDAKNQVISFPPITNSDITKMEISTKSMFIEVTSATSQGVCRKVLDTLLYELLLLGIGDPALPPEELVESELKNKKYHSISVQQVKIVDVEGNMKAVYPSRNDLVYEDTTVSVVRE